MIPVVDVEYYGDKEKNPPLKEQVVKVYFSPNMNLKNKWTLWQYSDTDVLNGYHGDETYIDRNVYCADKDQFQKTMVVAQ